MSLTRRAALVLSASALFQTACTKAKLRESSGPIQDFDDNGGLLGNAAVQKVAKTESDWMRNLTPQQYYVTRKKQTDRAFTGTYYLNKQPGLYRCICCEIAVFTSNAKYDSGTGWPSFTEPIAPENIRVNHEGELTLHEGLEVACARCDAHLGHVFDDGPAPAHLRYCINESSLRFVPASRRS